MVAALTGQATSRTEPTTLRPDHRLPVGVAVAVGLAWAVLVAAQAAGSHALDHDALLGGGPIRPAAIALFLIGWQVMVAAMMLPASFPSLRTLSVHPGQLGPFLAGFALVWTAFAWAALSLDSAVHRSADLAPWLASDHVIAGGLLVVVGLVELAPVTARCLSAARRWEPDGPESRTRRDSVGEGVRHGTACLGCDGPLMLLVFGLGRGSVAWMAAAALVMAAVRRNWLTPALHRWIGALLVGVGIGVVAAALV